MKWNFNPKHWFNTGRISKHNELNKEFFRDKLIDISTLFDAAIERFGISMNGENFYKEGLVCPTESLAEKYRQNKIKPLIENVAAYFEAKVSEYVDFLKVTVEELKGKIQSLEDELNETKPKGYLFRINKQIDYQRRIDDGGEIAAFPERQLQLEIDKVFFDNAKEVKSDNKFEQAGGSELLEAIKRNISIKKLRQSIESVKGLFYSYATLKHSNLYPPQRKYYNIFISLCVILSVAECGFTFQIVEHMMTYANLFQKIIYSIAISLSFAILYKNFIDSLLYRGFAKGVIFIIVSLTFFYILTIFFGFNLKVYEGDLGAILALKNSELKHFLQSFFSIVFAMANAWMFREATYLDGLYYRLNGSKRHKKLLHEKESYIQERVIRKNSYIQMKNKLETYQQAITAERKKRIGDILNRYEMIAYESFRQGVEIALAECIENNKEIVLAIKQKIKNKL